MAQHFFLYYEILSAKCVPRQGDVPRSSDFQENLVMVRCTMLWDEELCRVYHAEFVAWYAQRTGLNVLAKNRQSWQVNQASKSQKRDFRHFSGAKVCYSHRNVRFENFMHMEWSEEKFLKGIVGDKRRLSFWNKHQQIELVFMQLAR